MRKILLFIGGGILLIAALSIGRLYKTPTPAASPIPSPAPSLAETPVEHKTLIPDLVLEKYDGQPVRLHSFIGKPLVMNVWASWCPFCFKELPDLALVQAEFADKATVVAVNRAEEIATAKRFTDTLGITNSIVFLLDPQDMFYRAIGGFSMPETIFVDEKGFIYEHRRGPVDAAEVIGKIRKLLDISQP
jgi:thiol-disulfide isomerase/thioredoxin